MIRLWLGFWVLLDKLGGICNRFLQITNSIVIYQHSVQLEVVEGVECHPDEAWPMEHKLVENLWLHQLEHELVPLSLGDDVQGLVKHPDHFGRRGTVIKLEEHADTFEEESEVEIWWDQRVVVMDFYQPLNS